MFKRLTPCTTIPSYNEIKELEKFMLEVGHSGRDYPVTHRSADGLYSRELFMPAGMRLVGMMHAKSHFFVLLSGEITAWTDQGMRRMKAPQLFRTEPGTKRVIAAHTDSVIVTFHGTFLTDPDEIEAEIIVPEHEERQFLLELGRAEETLLLETEKDSK